MAAAMAELDVDRINPVGGALRLGVLYDLLGRTVRARHPRRDDRAVRDALPHRPRARGRASPRWRRALPHAPRRGRRRGGRAAARVGGAAARDRLLGLAHRLPQARRVHPAATPTCRVSRPASSASSRCSCWAAAAGSPRWRRALADPTFRAQLLALRLAVLFHHARRPIDAPRIGLERRRAHPSRDLRALAQGASADRPPAREGARRVVGARLQIRPRLMAGAVRDLRTAYVPRCAELSAACGDSRSRAPPRRFALGGTRDRRAGEPSLFGDATDRERVRRPTTRRHEFHGQRGGRTGSPLAPRPPHRMRTSLRRAVGRLRRLAIARSPTALRTVGPRLAARAARRNPGRSPRAARPTRRRSCRGSTATRPRPSSSTSTLPRRRAGTTRPRPASADGRRRGPARARRASPRPRAPPRPPRPAPSSSTVLNLRLSASAVCCARSAGETRMRAVSGRWPVEPLAHALGLLLPLGRQPASEVRLPGLGFGVAPEDQVHQSPSLGVRASLASSSRCAERTRLPRRDAILRHSCRRRASSHASRCRRGRQRAPRRRHALAQLGVAHRERDLDAPEQVAAHPVGRREPDVGRRRRSRSTRRDGARGSGRGSSARGCCRTARARPAAARRRRARRGRSRTPACEAAYSARITPSSSSAFILATMRAGLPARACAVSRRIISITRRCIVNGASSRCRSRPAFARLVMCRNTSFDVGAERGIGGQEPEVGVQARRARVVVAGAEVRVGPQPHASARVALPADQQRELGVRLQAEHAVDDLGAGLLEPLGPVDVRLLVEARHQLDDDGHFLAAARRLDQRLHQHRVDAGAIDGLLDRRRRRDRRRPCG